MTEDPRYTPLPSWPVSPMLGTVAPATESLKCDESAEKSYGDTVDLWLETAACVVGPS